MLFNYNNKLPTPKDFPGLPQQRYFIEDFNYKVFLPKTQRFQVIN